MFDDLVATGSLGAQRTHQTGRCVCVVEMQAVGPEGAGRGRVQKVVHDDTCRSASCVP